jgi:dTDP-glucose 4,6-dehydratase|tara:strand:+ start:1178 stop:2158 length:981 start_codon:yes stop_codon:yes gene_type:complete
MKNILITGGLGFIGSTLAKRLHNKYFDYKLFVLDNSKDQHSLDEVKDNVRIYPYDICEQRLIDKLFDLHKFDGVFHLASSKPVMDEEYKDNQFIKTNVIGTSIILNNCVKHKCRFLYVSDTEVYGSLDMDKRSHMYETNCYRPSTPYAASKASTDHLITSYYKKYGLDTVITNISSTYGPGQNKKNFMSVIIDCLLNNKVIPVFGSGENVRDWIYVDDVIDLLDLAYHKGVPGENYNAGGGTLNELNNLQLVDWISKSISQVLTDKVYSPKSINHLLDSAGHDLRHSVNYDKTTLRLRWKPKTSTEVGIKETIKWHIDKYGINNSI